MSKNVKSLTNREQLEKMEKMERKLQEFELQNNAVQVRHSTQLNLNIFYECDNRTPSDFYWENLCVTNVSLGFTISTETASATD